MKYLIHSIIILIILFIIPSLNQSITTATKINPLLCPSVEDLLPCTCSNDSLQISCVGIEGSKMKEIFDRISLDENVINNVYNKLHIDNDVMSEIPAQATGNVSFKQIIIESSSNTIRIHKQAFDASFNTLGVFEIQAKNAKSEVAAEDSEYSLIDLVNSFKKLTYLNIESEIDELKDKAFVENDNLEQMFLRVKVLSGSPFAKLTQLTYLTMRDSMLDYLPSKAFHFENQTNMAKSIYLNNNKLTGESFGENVFSELNNTMLYPEYNHITYLEQNIFMPYFNSNDNNILSLLGNPLDCSDCRMFWIFELKNQSNLDNRITNAYCDDGTSIWEDQNEESLSRICKSAASHNLQSTFLIIISFLAYKMVIN